MKVKRLIELLQNVDPERDIFVEGCDCIEEAAGISIPTKESAYGGEGEFGLMIRRNHGACNDEEGKIIK